MKKVRGPVFANFASLAAIQGVNLIAPFLTLPYLARVIGFEGLGILATAAATCAWLGLLIDWGFNLTATRAVSTRRDDLAEVRRIFSVVTMAKLALIVLSFVVLAGLWLAVPSVRRYYLAYLFSFTFVACQALPELPEAVPLPHAPPPVHALRHGRGHPLRRHQQRRQTGRSRHC